MNEKIIFLVQRALACADELEPAQRADLYEAAAAILENVDSDAFALARETASLIRHAEEHQLKFSELLNAL